MSERVPGDDARLNAEGIDRGATGGRIAGPQGADDPGSAGDDFDAPGGGVASGPEPEVGRAREAAPGPEVAPLDANAPARQPRPLIERIGMAGIALVLAALFGVIAVAAFSGGEPFLGVMGAIGSLMTLWVGALTLIRG